MRLKQSGSNDSGASRRILVTDGQDRSGLAGLRSLRAAGYDVDAVAYGGPAAAHWSRLCGRRLTVPDPRQRDGRPFVEGLARIVRGCDYATIVTGSDASLLAISRHRDLIESHVDVDLPRAETVERCLSKEELVKAAAAAGLDSPETHVCAGLSDAVAAASLVGFPVLVKPEKPVYAADADGMEQPGCVVAGDAMSLASAVGEYGTTVLVQRHERGPILSFSGVADGDGGLPARGTSRYSRTWPSDAGSASFAETIASPPELVAKVKRLLAELGWRGVFELELIRRPDGSVVAIDFNPRLFGSLELISAAGAPLAAIWCDLLRGDDLKPVEARAGLRYRWEEGEARYLWRALRERRLRGVLAVLRPRHRVVRSFFRLTDPAPLPARLIFLLRHRLRGDRGW